MRHIDYIKATKLRYRRRITTMAVSARAAAAAPTATINAEEEDNGEES